MRSSARWPAFNFARFLREAGPFRWVGLYDVDRGKGELVNLVWDGRGPPVFPVFPITKGLTGSAIANQSLNTDTRVDREKGLLFFLLGRIWYHDFVEAQVSS